MNLFFPVVFTILMIVAPLISKEWGKQGELAWGIISMVIFILAIVFWQ